MALRPKSRVDALDWAVFLPRPIESRAQLFGDRLGSPGALPGRKDSSPFIDFAKSEMQSVAFEVVTRQRGNLNTRDTEELEQVSKERCLVPVKIFVAGDPHGDAPLIAGACDNPVRGPFHECWQMIVDVPIDFSRERVFIVTIGQRW